jgi:hypothetical protein
MPVKAARLQLFGLMLLLAAGLLMLAPVKPVQAQGFFDSLFGYPRYQQPQRSYPSQRSYQERERPVDTSKAPPPSRKADAPPASTVLVLGDSMADWLAYGLEDALGDSNEIGVIRKNRTYSGLIRYEPRSDTPDWAQAARDIIASEKPSYIVMMVGLNDRQSIRERAPAPRQGAPGAPAGPGTAAAPAPGSAPAPSASEQNPEQEAEQPAGAPDRRPRVAGTHEFRAEKWAEIYSKRIDDVIAVLKSRGVPVFWMGLPAVRGTRSTSDMQYLNDLFRTRAEKNGIIFVDVWDGFVDESNRFALHGPDFEGQNRRLRTADGVHFTKAGARKLAHYLQREIDRASQRGPVSVALPAAEPQQDKTAKPSGPTARPLSGPVVPLTSPTEAADQELLGGNAKGPAAHVTATRVLVNGEPVVPPAGRGDDFSWPRRGVAPFGTDPVVATTNLPLPEMQAPPPKTTVSAPSVEPTVAAAAPRRTAPRPQPLQQRQVQQRSFSPFPFFPFFR